MLFGETVAVYCENHTEHTDTISIYRNLRKQQISVLVLLCTSYTTCFGPYWWPSSSGFVTQKNSNAVTVCQRIRCFSMLICKLDINI
jgi:hypothetical protein